jgi:F-type H+-transporting ATPase subunit b
MALFDITFIHSQLFWLFVCFFTLLVFMYKFAGPAISKGLDDRANQIKQDLQDAKKLKEEAEALLNDYNKKMEDANKKADDLIKKAKENAKAVSEKEAGELEKALAMKSKQAQKQIDSAKKKAIKEIKSEVHELVITATEKLIGETVDNKKAKELTKQALDDLK